MTEKRSKKTKLEKKKTRVDKKIERTADTRVGCPICGDKDNLVSQGRCVTCLSCGWSTCNI